MRIIGALGLVLTLLANAASAGAQTTSAASTSGVAVGPQYDTTHVYVAAEDFDRLVTSFVATFGGSTSKQGVADTEQHVVTDGLHAGGHALRVRLQNAGSLSVRQ